MTIGNSIDLTWGELKDLMGIEKPVIGINFLKSYDEVIDDILSIPVVEPMKSYDEEMDEFLDFCLSLIEDDCKEAD